MILALSALPLIGASCESCPDTSVDLIVSGPDNGVYRAEFARDVFLEDGDARDDGLLIEIGDGSSTVGRYQPTRATPADGIVAGAEITDARTVLIRVDPDREDLAPLEFTIRADTAGACAGPTGRATG